ncbi:sporulation-delaying protein SdpB family protein [Streptomyces europaeiscabiei]|uniref:sporulation-delaying protein SdpB family protein n=1 Tax=Streptomyces europaeiscabiei TaxID=146819 RepID=UPI0038F76D0B
MLRIRIPAVPEAAERFDPRTNVYGLMRTLMAVGMFATLFLTPAAALFHPVIGMKDAPYCDGLSAISGFCVGGDALSPEVRRYLLAAVLIPVVIGWRPRFWVIPHWWVAFSIASSLSLPEGGDAVALILTLSIVPFGLVDDRKWHWSTEGGSKQLGGSAAAFCYVTHWAIRIQVAGIYFQSSVAKFGVAEWADGTALAYWLSDPFFGLLPFWQPVMQPLLENAYTVTALTWGVLVMELALAFSLFWKAEVRRKTLWLGIALHAGIALFMGLFSFAFIMFGALVIAYRVPTTNLALPRFAARRVRRVRRARRAAGEDDACDASVRDTALVPG